MLDNSIAPNSIGFLSIDDTLSKHSIKSKCMDGLGFHYSHTDGKCVLSHCVVTCSFTVGDTSIPINHSMYYKEDYCKTFDEKFRSKQSIARTFIQEFKFPSNCKKYMY